MKPIANFLRGAVFYFSGLGKLFRHPSLFALSAIPILLTIIFLSGFALGGAYLIGRWLENYPAFGAENMILVQALVVITALFLAYLVYLPLTRIFLAPISERLSLRTTKIIGKPTMAENELGFFHAIAEGLKLVVVQLCFVIVIFLLTIFLPPIGVPLGIFATICFCGMDFLDVPLSIRGYSFRQKWDYWRKNLSTVLGFSLAAYLLLHIPVINLLALPVGIIGATLLLEEGSRNTE